jgi:HSP90 family molecular chaperone
MMGNNVNLREVFCCLPFFLSMQVTVSTKSAKADKQYVWEGEADTSSYTIAEEKDPEKLIPRGTVITLHLKVLFEKFYLCL